MRLAFRITEKPPDLKENLGAARFSHASVCGQADLLHIDNGTAPIIPDPHRLLLFGLALAGVDGNRLRLERQGAPGERSR